MSKEETTNKRGVRSIDAQVHIYGKKKQGNTLNLQRSPSVCERYGVVGRHADSDGRDGHARDEFSQEPEPLMTDLFAHLGAHCDVLRGGKSKRPISTVSREYVRSDEDLALTGSSPSSLPSLSCLLSSSRQAKTVLRSPRFHMTNNGMTFLTHRCLSLSHPFLGHQRPNCKKT